MAPRVGRERDRWPSSVGQKEKKPAPFGVGFEKIDRTKLYGANRLRKVAKLTIARPSIAMVVELSGTREAVTNVKSSR